MKKLIAVALAASLVGTPVLAAPAQRDHRAQTTQTQQRAGPAPVRVQAPARATNNRPVVRQTVNVRQNQQHRTWRAGQRFDSRYASNYREIRNPRSYRLNAAPRGYHWVQSGNDAILVGIASGLISAIVANAIR